MASPLSPAQDAALNLVTPPTATRRYDEYDVKAISTESRVPADSLLHNSPPSASSKPNETHASDQENISPSKSRHSRVLSGTELSPLRIVESQQRSSIDGIASSNLHGFAPPSQARSQSPRKSSPEKRFPVKISPSGEITRASQERSTSLEVAVQQNKSLKRAIDIFEDEQSELHMDVDDSLAPCVQVNSHEMDEDDTACPDESMISTFSTFSAVPSMTMFANIGSPSKLSGIGGTAPRARPDPSPSRSIQRTSADDSGNTTNLLMDFTEQLRYPHKSPAKRGNLSPSRTTPNILATPSRGFSNLIDFDIPPMPTPRSLPSVTPRELESLKSKFLSEISSLKASLSGKEAEVHSLKSAVGDAEKRVGESMEQLREECTLKEQLSLEKQEWENRGREMETVLRRVKEEIVLGQRERENLEQQLDESEKRREAAEILHQEAESKIAGMRAGKDSDKSSPEKAKSPEAPLNREVEVAVERVARELHALYKSKHETKVAALKKSYEGRWEKKVRELESRIEELSDDNEKLRIGRDATMTKVDPGIAGAEQLKLQAVRDSAAIKELHADVQRLEAVVSTVQRDNEDLWARLEKERIEKGELVQLAEEMMSMQSFVSATPAPQRQQMQPPSSRPQPPSQLQQERAEFVAKTPKASATVDGLARSVGRVPGLRAPGTGTGLRAPHERTKSGGIGLPRPGARSGIMNSIEKMGNYRGRQAE